LGKVVGGATSEVRSAAVGIAFLFSFVIPLLVTMTSAVLLHLGSMATGGAPGGWRRTFREVALNRILSDGCVLLAGVLVSFLPLEIGAGLCLSLLLLSLVRVTFLIFLLVRMAKIHQLGSARVRWLGVPGVCMSAAVAILLSIAPAIWFWAGSVVRCALG